MSRPYFVHIRNSYETPFGKVIGCKGGTTVAISGNQDIGYKAAYARCSFNDNYCKRTGRTIAAGRLNSDFYAFSLPDDITDMKSAETYVRALFV